MEKIRDTENRNRTEKDVFHRQKTGKSGEVGASTPAGIIHRAVETADNPKSKENQRLQQTNRNFPDTRFSIFNPRLTCYIFKPDPHRERKE